MRQESPKAAILDEGLVLVTDATTVNTITPSIV